MSEDGRVVGKRTWKVNTVFEVFEAKLIEGVSPLDFIDYFERLPELYELNVVDQIEGCKVIKDIQVMPEPMEDGIMIEALYGPHFNEKTGELIYVESTIGNEELEAKHITDEEKKKSIVANMAACWIVSPVMDR